MPRIVLTKRDPLDKDPLDKLNNPKMKALIQLVRGTAPDKLGLHLIGGGTEYHPGYLRAKETPPGPKTKKRNTSFCVACRVNAQDSETLKEFKIEHTHYHGKRSRRTHTLTNLKTGAM